MLDTRVSDQSWNVRPAWIYEHKYDGFGAIAEGGTDAEVQIYHRQHNSFNKLIPGVSDVKGSI